ncbi:hypothetical protein [Streptomyces sp. NPDC088752]|uniref:hypothetical protein n=1 Tax=Streptomyces sp. NPDC088752 TaxID=3154963 RepID=UPI0034340A8B
MYLSFVRSDGSKGVFDTHLAVEFDGESPQSIEEEGFWEANLFLTAEDHWVLNNVALGKNSKGSAYIQVDGDRARAWMERNGHTEAVTRYFERPKGGRPGVGEKLFARVPARTYNQIADLAELYAEDMSSTVRRLLHEALTHRETIGAPGSR